MEEAGQPRPGFPREVYTDSDCARFLSLPTPQVADAFLLAKLALLQCQAGHLEDGRALLAQAEEVLALSSRPQQCRALVLIGLLHWDHLSGHAEAIRCFQKAAKLAPAGGKGLPPAPDPYGLPHFLASVAAYCGGDRDGFRRGREALNGRAPSDTSQVGQSCRVLLSLIAHVEYGEALADDDVEFDAHLPMPCFAFLWTALLSHLCFSAGKFAAFETRNRDVAAILLRFLSTSGGAAAPAPRWPAYLLPVLCVWLTTQVEVYSGSGTSHAYTVDRGDHDRLQALFSRVGAVPLEGRPAAAVEQKLQAVTAAVAALARRHRPARPTAAAAAPAPKPAPPVTRQLRSSAAPPQAPEPTPAPASAPATTTTAATAATAAASDPSEAAAPQLPAAALVPAPPPAVLEPIVYGDDIVDTAYLLVGLRGDKTAEDAPPEKKRRRRSWIKAGKELAESMAAMEDFTPPLPRVTRPGVRYPLMFGSGLMGGLPYGVPRRGPPGFGPGFVPTLSSLLPGQGSWLTPASLSPRPGLWPYGAPLGPLFPPPFPTTAEAPDGAATPPGAPAGPLPPLPSLGGATPTGPGPGAPAPAVG